MNGRSKKRTQTSKKARVIMALMLIFSFLPIPHETQAITFPSPSHATSPQTNSLQAPLLFEPNVGQAAHDMDFIVHTGNDNLEISARGIQSTNINQILVNANAEAKPEAQQKQSSITNYFIGNDPSKWKTEVPNFKKIAYHNVYPNIDAEYLGTDDGLEYQFVVNPGGDPNTIQLALENITAMEVKADGITAQTANGTIHWNKLYAYQITNDNEVKIEAAFVAYGEHEYGFAIGTYDTTKPLIIDPVLQVQYATYLGGSGSELARPVIIDSSGQAIVYGTTASTNFPTTSPIQAANGGGTDLFLTKFNSAGTGLIFSTYIGGSGTDSTFKEDIALDSSGNIIVGGNTTSSDFPTASPYQASLSGTQDIFLMKINAAGSTILYSTYFGGTGSETFGGVALDSGNAMYITGSTASTDFPTASPYQASNAGGTSDIILTKFNAAGSALVYSTYLGTSSLDTALYVTVDSSGSAYVAGQTPNSAFPVTGGAYQTTYGGGGFDATITKFSASGTTLVYSTFLGGSGSDFPGTLILEPGTNNIWMYARTASTNFPMVSAIQGTYGGGLRDLYVSKINAAGTSLLFSTYYGGSGDDENGDMVRDASGNLYIGGYTLSSDFPISNAVQSILSGGQDAFVFRINTNLTVEFSTFYGGTGAEQSYGIALDTGNNIFLSGQTTSTDFVTVTPYQGTNSGGNDAFLMKIAYPTSQNTTGNVIHFSREKIGVSSTFSIDFTLPAGIRSGVLTVTFPVGFTVTAAGSGGSSSACLGSFGFTASTLTATKTACTGSITLGGATVTNPGTTGSYTITWVNDDPGSAVVAIVDSDQVSMSANVDPFLTTNIGAQTAACDGTFSGSVGTLALGMFSSTVVTSSDASSVPHICIRISTNAVSGAVATVKSTNASLKSTATPADIIPSNTATPLAIATEGYGLCVGSALADTGTDTSTPAGATPVRVSPFDGTCTSAAHNIGALTTGAQNIFTLSSPTKNAFARVYLKAGITASTKAHSDYADTLTFIVTGTF